MRPTYRLAQLASVLAALGCGCGCDGAPQRQTGLQAAAVRQAFEPPRSDGWGLVEGLRYREVVRGGAAPEAQLPLVLIIHGMGDHPGDHWFESIRIDFPARVILPQAPKPYLDGFSWFTYRVGDNEPHALGAEIAAAADRLARALDTLQAQRPTLGKPIVVGFSQGGMLSLALAVRHPERLRFALPIGGMLPAPLWPPALDPAAPNPPIRALHGEADGVVPIAPTRDLIAQLQRLGYDASLQTFEGVGHSISPQMRDVVERSLTEAARGL